MVGEDTFYEAAETRDDRFRALVHIVTKSDPNWIRGFIPYLREEMYMRSASIVAAAEYVAAGGPNGRDVISSAIMRADEPAELLAYWHDAYGRAEPMPIKRGISDALNRVYTEYSAAKYDGADRAWRMGDVIERVHAVPGDEHQRVLYKYLLGIRFEYDPTRLKSLPVLAHYRAWKEAGSPLPDDGALPRAVTWEELSATHKMDAKAWEAVIPQMGYMALLRNLRNFENAQISPLSVQYVRERLADPELIAKSKQFPFRFLSALKALESHTYSATLESALEASVVNIPAMGGNTCVYVDCSGSMYTGFSRQGSLSLWEQAAVFGAALAKRCERVNLLPYATTYGRVNVSPGSSVLKLVERIAAMAPQLGGSTETLRTVASTAQGADRVIIVTDEQTWPGPELAHLPLIYTFNVAGYRTGHQPSGTKGRHTFGGLSDKSFTMLKVLETVGSAGWPWEDAAYVTDRLTKAIRDGD